MRKFSQWHLFVQIWWHTHCIIYHYSCNTDTLSIPYNSEYQNSLLQFDLTIIIFSNLPYSWNVLKILKWLNIDSMKKSRLSLNIESCKLREELKGKILQVNQFTPVGNTMDLFWLMHEVSFVEIVNIFWFLFFVFGVFFPAKLNEFA